ncbi:cytochrome c [Deltaproteobacteria bacterium TL4]
MPQTLQALKVLFRRRPFSPSSWAQLVVLCGCLMCLLTTNASSAFAQEKINVKQMAKYRKIFMDIKGYHHQALKLLVTQNIGLSEQIITHAETLSKMAEDILLLFPKGSLSDKSRTLPSIWDKEGNLVPGFIKQAENMKVEARKLAQIAKTGNRRAVNAQLRNFDSEGCRGCHTLYRGGEDEPELFMD